MSNPRPVDERAIMLRYAMSWRSCALYVLAMSMFMLPQLPIVDGGRLREKWRRLDFTARLAEDPQVAEEAQRQLTAFESSWAYQSRHLVRFGPYVFGALLLIPVYRTGVRARGAVRWARHGQCPGCGYDLQGSGYQNACPECGTPPAPLKGERASKRTRARWKLSTKVVMPAVIFASFAAFVLTSGGIPGMWFFRVLEERKVESAFRDAPRVLVRWVRVVSDEGSWQYAFVHEPGTGFTRQEWWELSELVDAIVSPVDSGCERYLPATGVEQQALDRVPPGRLNYLRSFREVQIGGMASAVWYETERVASGPEYDVYRRVSRSGLHDHHARELTIVVIDAKTRRPLYGWSGTFDEMLDPDAVPTVRRLWITTIEYPETSPGRETRRLDDAKPGVLHVDWPINPDWLDDAWIDPVLDD